MRLQGLWLVCLVALAACGQSAPSDGTGGRTLIRFATDWRAEAEHGGFYEALATGEYAGAASTCGSSRADRP
jgi:NitT/TauT family transport system substrate-binding protein